MKSYRALLDRIAVTLIVNSALFVLSFDFLSLAERIITEKSGESTFTDVFFRLLECVIYFASFTLPILLYRKTERKCPTDGNTASLVPVTKLSPVGIFFGIGAGLGVTVIFSKLNYFILSFTDYAEYTYNYFRPDVSRDYRAVIYFIYIAVIPAIAEELLFRKLVCGELRRYGIGVAVISSGVLFGLMHANAGQVLYASASGMILAWLFVKTGSVIYPIILHFVNNAVSAVVVIVEARYSYDTALALSEKADLIMILWLVAALIYFYVKYLCLKRVSVSDEHKETGPAFEGCALTKGEKIKGFFSVGIVIYIFGSVLRMVYYLCLSFVS